MFEQAERFGGSLFALAAGVVTDLLHHEPLSYRALEAEGLPAAFIVAIKCVCVFVYVCVRICAASKGGCPAIKDQAKARVKQA
eukprot:1159550-Pelagomonas_calceolata.AAC.4